MTEEEKKIITQEKHPGRIAQGHKLAALIKSEKKKYCTAKDSLQNSLHYSQRIFMSMALVRLRSLPLVFVYFLHILKIKNLSMKNRTNHQNNVICFKRTYTINE